MPRWLLVVVALSAIVTPAVAFPICPANSSGVHVSITVGVGKMTETERAALIEQQLRARGIDAENTRFWEGCVQTFVTENGHVKMKFYDPDTLEEVR